jgi:3-hydroxyisobutyrate dehydrogenase-like beta-hydroxyacid dehydrogenase
MKIGVLGLGTMGAGMADNLAAAGLELMVCNRSEDKRRPFAERGIPTTGDPRELADCDAVVTMLANDAAVRAAFVESGLLTALRPEALHISSSTISLELADDLTRLHGEHGSRWVACPVSGRGDLARAGKLFLIVAGAEADRERCEPVFAAIGQRTFVFGDNPRKAVVIKLAVNQMIASSLAMMGESIALAERHGISGDTFVSFFSQSLFACPVFQAYGPLIAEKRYQPANFTTELGLKDLRLAQAASDEVGAQPALGPVVREMMTAALEQGHASDDWASIGEIARQRAGTPQS